VIVGVADGWSFLSVASAGVTEAVEMRHQVPVATMHSDLAILSCVYGVRSRARQFRTNNNRRCKTPLTARTSQIAALTFLSTPASSIAKVDGLCN
jgi:hypothetical protein